MCSLIPPGCFSLHNSKIAVYSKEQRRFIGFIRLVHPDFRFSKIFKNGLMHSVSAVYPQFETSNASKLSREILSVSKLHMTVVQYDAGPGHHVQYSATFPALITSARLLDD